MKKARRGIAYAFIDSQNLNLGTSKDIYKGRKRIYEGWKLDFKKFRIYLADKFKVKKAFLFIGYLKKNEKLYKCLKSFGYELVFKPTVSDQQGNVKGNVDAELVLYAVDLVSVYDKAIIVTGDGDFHCLVEYLLKKRKLGRLLVPNQKRYTKLFLKFKSHIEFMNNLEGKLKIKKGVLRLRTKP